MEGGQPDGPPAGGQPAMDQQAQILAAAQAIAQAQALAAAEPPPGLNQFPLAQGDILGDSFLTCGITDPKGQYSLYTTEGLNSLSVIQGLDFDHIDDMAHSLGRRPQNQGGFRLTASQQGNLKALLWWIKDRRDRGLEEQYDRAFTPADLAQAKEQLAAWEQAVKYPTSLERPEKFGLKKGNWVSWWQSVKNYLGSVMGVRRRSLFYVVRPETAPANPTAIETEMYQVVLQGPQYQADNERVYRILKSLTIDTVADGWVKRYDRSQDGRGAALALMAQYEGDGQVQQRYQEAKSALEAIYYKGNEAVYPFSKYTSKLQEIFQAYEDANRPKSGTDKVDDLITKMQVPDDGVLLNIKMDARRRFPDSYEDCVSFIAAEISMHKRPASDPSKRGRKISEVGTHKRFRRGGGDGRGRGGRGRGRDGGRGRGGRGRGSQAPVLVNNVDITDATRTFTRQEMDKLGPNGQREMYARRRQLIQQRNPGGGTPGTQGGRAIAATERSNQQESQSEPTEEQSSRGDNHGQAFGRGTGGRGRGTRR